MSHATEPADVARLKELLTAVGVREYEPRVLSQLLELKHRFATTVLRQAAELAQHRGAQATTVDDVRLAVRFERELHGFRLPPRQAVAELALARNSVPLPLIPDRHAVRLPPPNNQLTRDLFDVTPTDEAVRKAGGGAAAGSQAAIKPSMAKGSRNKRVAPQTIEVTLAKRPRADEGGGGGGGSALAAAPPPVPL